MRIKNINTISPMHTVGLRKSIIKKLEKILPIGGRVNRDIPEHLARLAKKKGKNLDIEI